MFILAAIVIVMGLIAIVSGGSMAISRDKSARLPGILSILAGIVIVAVAAVYL